MSPDDATGTSPQAAEPVEEAATKKSLKERMAFLSKGGEKMDKVPGINMVPKSMRVLLVIFVVAMVIVAAWAVMRSGGDDTPEPKSNTINPAKLDDFSWSSGPVSGSMSEFQESMMSLSSMLSNGTILVDSVEMYLEWQDEPDQTWAGRVRENEPDSFQLRIAVGNETVESQMTPNDAGSKQGNVALSLDMSSTNFTYVMVGNASDIKLPDGVGEVPINLYIIMGEAGDLYASGPALFKLNDFGNDYTLTVSVTGKVVPD